MASGKLDTQSFQDLLTPDLLRLESLFRSRGYSFRLVGGVVRDLLLGLRPKDVDISTECTPDAMIKLFEENGIRHIPTGIAHGTVTVHTGSADYEITTLRLDRVTDGRHAVVEFTTDWREDAERRDLTINAMSLELDGTLYDYFDGQKHLEEKKVTFVGDARKRIREDFLRILRYFRFYGRIVPSPDLHCPDVLEAIRETAQGLQRVSAERVWAEMKMILLGKHCPHLLRTMYGLGVAKHIDLPAEGNTAELEKVWTSMQTKGYSLQPVSLLMALVHTTQQAEAMAPKWRLSNLEKKLGVFVVQHRAQAYQPNVTLKPFQDHLVDGVPVKLVVELLHYCGRLELTTELQEWKIPKCPFNGHDLQAVGIPSGSVFGKIRRQLIDRWKESYFTLNKEELLEYASKLNHKQ